MGKERVIFSNRFDRPTLEQIEEEMKKENYDDNENLMSAEEFLDFMKKNRRTTVLLARLVRLSTKVRSIPSIFKPGLIRFLTREMV